MGSSSNWDPFLGAPKEVRHPQRLTKFRELPIRNLYGTLIETLIDPVKEP